MIFFFKEKIASVAFSLFNKTEVRGVNGGRALTLDSFFESGEIINDGPDSTEGLLKTLLSRSVEPRHADDGQVHHLPVVEPGEVVRAARLTELHHRGLALAVNLNGHH